MLNLVKAALLLCVWIASTSSQKYSFQGKEYFLIKENKKFDDANTLCSSRGERLLHIKNQDEQDFVYNSIVKQLDNYVWLGATNVFGTKTFKWIGDGSELTFSNWYPGTPDGDGNQRNGVHMTNNPYNGKWDDWSVTYTCYVVCEQGPKTLTYLDKEYFASNQLKSFDEAVTICENRNESLLQIKNAVENDFVFNMIVKSSNKAIWLGATKAIGNGTYIWLDGSDLVYSNWLIGQPSGDINQLNAILMNPNNSSKWSDSSTNGTRYFICEKVSIYALKSSLLGLDSKLTAAINNVTEEFKTELEVQLYALAAKQDAIEEKLDKFIESTKNMPTIKWI